MANATRRALLGSAGVFAVGLFAYGGSRYACSFVKRNHADFFSLLDIVPDTEAARRIGAAALVSDRLAADLPGLAERLRDRPLIRDALATGCPTSQRTCVQDQCALDFAEGRTIVVDGWVLSETEATLCAARLLRGTV